MDTLSTGLLAPISPLAAHFRARTWTKALTLIVGAILCPGARTVANCLRALGLDARTDFCKYHRVLSRARWSGLACGRTLLRLLVDAFAPGGEALVFAVDETVERRWGRRIAARGIYRDAVRSSDSFFVKTSGLRWMSLMLVVSPPWARSAAAKWALPVLTALCPSRRYYGPRPRAAKTLADWARQLIGYLGRYVADARTGLGRACVLVGDRAYCTYGLLAAARDGGVALVTDMRLDARLFDAPPARTPGRVGRPALTGARLPPIASLVADDAVSWRGVTVGDWRGGGERALDYTSGTATWYKSGQPLVEVRWVLTCDPLKSPGQEGYLRLLVSSDAAMAPEQLIRYYAMRWSCEVTFQEARRHLGVESQRQWSARACARTTPGLLALYSVVFLIARARDLPLRPRTAAWYPKARVTSSDVLAAVREDLWPAWINHTSARNPDVGISDSPLTRLRATVRYLRRVLVRTAA